MQKLYTCEEVALRFGVKIDTVWGWIREGKLVAINTGKKYSITPQDLEAFEQSRKTRPA